jgi:CRP-like cAMP-binding protein
MRRARFSAGAPGDPLHIVGRGKVEVLANGMSGVVGAGGAIAVLGEGHAFGEMSCWNSERTILIGSLHPTASWPTP